MWEEIQQEGGKGRMKRERSVDAEGKTVVVTSFEAEGDEEVVQFILSEAMRLRKGFVRTVSGYRVPKDGLSIKGVVTDVER